MLKSSAAWDRVLAQYRPFIIAQGEVGYAHNLLQERFFHVFVLVNVLEIGDPLRQSEFYPYSLALWHTSSNDNSQRQLAMTALKNLPTKLDISGGIVRLEWARQQADELAKYRNLIVHSPLTFTFGYKDGKLTPPAIRIGGPSVRPTHRDRLRLIKRLQFWKALRNDFLNLSDYVEQVRRQIAWRAFERQRGGGLIPGARRAWPRKPRLPCVRRIDLIEQALKAQRAPPPPKRKRRRQPSGGRRPPPP
jgi:hypothetical protein